MYQNVTRSHPAILTDILLLTRLGQIFIHKMADLSLTSMTPDQLRLEVDRLQRELDQTSSEKIQSAQYGLVLLEEKEQLEIRCEELETLYDTTKNELDVTQEALAKFQSNQQVSMHTLKWNSLSYLITLWNSIFQ